MLLYSVPCAVTAWLEAMLSETRRLSLTALWTLGGSSEALTPSGVRGLVPGGAAHAEHLCEPPTNAKQFEFCFSIIVHLGLKTVLVTMLHLRLNFSPKGE